jgi:predicted dehydrogenase
MKQLIEGGKLGQIYQVKAGWIRETGIPARTGWFTNKKLSGGGPLIDLGVHMLDMVMWLLGYPAPLTVTGDIKANFGVRGHKVWHTPGDQMPTFEVEDLALAFIRLANQVSLSLETSWASHARPGMDDFFVTILGTEGTVELYVANYTNKETLTLYTEVNGTPVTIRPNLHFEQSDHIFAVAEFIKCIKQNLPPTATAEQGLTIMNIIDAIYQSAALGREVVLETAK